MSGKRNKPLSDTLNPSVRVPVVGKDFDTMILQAKVEAAAFLNCGTDDLIITSHTTPTIHSTTRFRRHLADTGFIESWHMDVVVLKRNERTDHVSSAPTES